MLNLEIFVLNGSLNHPMLLSKGQNSNKLCSINLKGPYISFLKLFFYLSCRENFVLLILSILRIIGSPKKCRVKKNWVVKLFIKNKVITNHKRKAEPTKCSRLCSLKAHSENETGIKIACKYKQLMK